MIGKGTTVFTFFHVTISTIITLTPQARKPMWRFFLISGFRETISK
jgi:hypothetical protein